MPNDSGAGSTSILRDGMLQAAFQNDISGEGLFEAVAGVESDLSKAQDAPFLIKGLQGGATSLMLAAWYKSTGRVALVVTADRESAVQMADDLEMWLGQDKVIYLPQTDVLAFDRNSPETAVVGDFLAGLHRMRQPGPLLVVTSLYAMRQRIMAPSVLEKASLVLKIDQRLDLDSFCIDLANRGYRTAGMVAKVGDFARRGGLLDVFTPDAHPIRIEFFDDEIISIRRFNVETQRTIELIDGATILPVSHMLLDDDAMLSCLAEVESSLVAGGDISTDQQEFLDDLEGRLEDRLADDGLESFLPWFGATATVSDYLPDGCTVFWNEPVRLAEQSTLMDGEFPRLRSGRLEKELVLPLVTDLVLPGKLLKTSRSRHVLLAGSWIKGDKDVWLGSEPQQSCSFSSTGQNLQGGDVKLLHEALAANKSSGTTSLLLCDNEGQARRLTELLEEISGSDLVTLPRVGSISAGFVWPDVGINVLTDHEFFQRYRRPTRTRQRSSGLVKERASLVPGEFVVHLEYGIGHYKGLRIITVEGRQRECLLLEYADAGKVFLPVENIDQVERYSSDRGANPPLAKLGSGSWLKIKGKARKSIRAMAAELIELYASREAKPGFAFPADSPLQKALEDSFLFTETPDQLTAIADTKHDMERAQPMDRLVCGDVGFGKTEVAIRAAFKAVDAGKQVAILCPTTLLAQQHGETFSERFRDFPVRVEAISRFKTPAEQKVILKDCADGKVDVLVGTHRLLSRDVKFKELGLLVIDEEQRFGVRHKERIKDIKRQVDVMTLSATPIPRTLYLALMGARDMSLINTPPRDRLPIHTELCAFSKQVLVEAILREVHRGGQVFYVHNRVQTIEATAQLIRQLLPNVRVAHAHGQMKEEQLEKIMIAFLNQEFDVLVTTTIIESGLDMPRVNTIVIDRADRFGLAQLYQLRGRVGRSNQRAFAYLMTPAGEKLTPEARRRLAALEEFQALGSGYHIAMRDLEIRGSGNLLGEEQSGHMEAIGYDLYCRLLEETVAELRGGGGVAPLNVKIELPVAAYLPDDYVGDPQHKMDLYRKIARIRKVGACGRLRDEFKDRYGPLPDPVVNLLTMQRLRVQAGFMGIDEIRGLRDRIDFFFAGEKAPKPHIIQGLMESGPKGLKFDAVDQLIMKVPASRDSQLAVASAMLGRLDELRNKE